MVHPLGLRAVYSPALHFLLLGGFIYSSVIYYETKISLPLSNLSNLKIAAYQIEQAKQDFFLATDRLPNAQEQQILVNNLIDKEVLYNYAVQLGLNNQPVVERRLAQVAAFVEENKDEPQSQGELALQSMKLGLQEGDLVVRRILIDSARRLIRATALVRLPNEEMLKAYLESNSVQFQRPAQTRVRQIMFNRLIHADQTENIASETLAKLLNNKLTAERAAELGDDSWISDQLPLLDDKELIRYFDYDFVKAIKDLPLHTWSKPIPSRYGWHLVMIQERQSAYVPPLTEIKKDVRRHLLQKLADDWLSLRLQQLRQEFEVVIK